MILLVYWMVRRLTGVVVVLAMFVMATTLYFLKYCIFELDVPFTFDNWSLATDYAWILAKDTRGLVCPQPACSTAMALMTREMMGFALPVNVCAPVRSPQQAAYQQQHRVWQSRILLAAGW